MALNVDQWTFLSILNIADQFKDVSIQILVDYIGQIHYHVVFEFIKGTREKLHLFHLLRGVGLNPSLSLFLLVTVIGEKESTATIVLPSG